MFLHFFLFITHKVSCPTAGLFLWAVGTGGKNRPNVWRIQKLVVPLQMTESDDNQEKR